MILLHMSVLSIDTILYGFHWKLMKAGCRRKLCLTCFVTVFLLSGPRIFGCLGKSAGERRFSKAKAHILFAPSAKRRRRRKPRARKRAGALVAETLDDLSGEPVLPVDEQQRRLTLTPP